MAERDPAAKPIEEARASSASKPTPRQARKEWGLKKPLRLLSYGVVVSMGIGVLTARSIYGDVKDSALALGHELGKMGDVGSKRPLRINGESIYVASTTEPLPLGEVLDRVEKSCRENSAGMVAELETMSESLKRQLPPSVEGPRAAGIFREDRAGRGVVACLARDEGKAPEEAGEILDRLTTFFDTGDLSKIGKLRYVYAESTAKNHTHIVAAWTDGPFNIYRLVPEDGQDAPGADPNNAPRPPNASRMLTADIEGVPYGVRIYESTSTPAEVIALYDAEMALRGWDPLLGTPGDGASQRVYMRSGVDLMLFAEPEYGRTFVSLIEMRSK